jgi:hypothetical protein
MADTRVQRSIERWVRDTWLRRKYRQPFSAGSVRLASGGTFGFDAVSDDRRIVACISTSSARTASDKQGAGKIHKIRSDMLFLLLARAKRRLALFTERDMATFWRREQMNGRLPRQIEVMLVPLRGVMRMVLRKAQRRSSREVSSGLPKSRSPDPKLFD